MSVSGIDDDDDKWLDRARRASPAQRLELLDQAAAEDDTARIDILIGLGTDINAPVAGRVGRAFLMAVRHGHARSVQHFIDRGLELDNVKDDALAAAALNGHEALCDFFLRLKADPRANDSQCLQHAVIRGNVRIIDRLLRAGADIHCAGGSLLKQAMTAARPAPVKALVLHGADLSRPIHGRNAMQWAQALKMTEIEKFLALFNPPALNVTLGYLRHLTPARLQDPDPLHDGFTPMQLAAYGGHMQAALAILTQDGRKLTRSDLITATPRHPQTVLYILGSKGQLAQLFTPQLWQGRQREMEQAYQYIPAAFRAQVDLAHLQAAFVQDKLRKKQSPRYKLGRKP